MKRTLRLGTLLILVHVLSSTAWASLERQWSELKTPHFRIVFDAKHKQVAQIYARQAERARSTLLKYYTEAPEVTVVFIDDSTDVANGTATALPYPYLRIFPAYPTPLDSIGDYEDWVFELMVHEYAHLLTFEPSQGIYRPMRWLFGNVARPNFLLPRWYHEGMSVFWESYLSGTGGRLRSPSQQADLRALVLSGQLLQQDMSLWNEALPDWMGGRRAYILGGVLFHHLYQEQNKDPAALTDLTYSYSRRLPYMLQGPVRSRWGKSYQDLTRDAFSKLQSQALDQHATLSAPGAPVGMGLPDLKGLEWRSPKFSPDGQWLAAIAQGENLKYRIHFFKVTPDGLIPADLKFPADKKILSFDWAPDSSFLIFDRLGSYRREATYFDLYRFDLASSKSRRLTRGLRSMEPALSPDGSLVVFRQNHGGGSRLGVVDVSGKNQRTLHTPPLASRISSPEFLTAEHIVFTQRDASGTERLYRLSTSGQSSPHELHADYAPIYSPRSTAQGLMFRSDRSGVPNLYLATLDGQIEALTNSYTRVLDGDLHPHQGTLAFSEVTSEGPRLKIVPAGDLKKLPTLPPDIPPLLQVETGEISEDEGSHNSEERAYQPARYMLPRYLMPFLFFQEQGYTVQALTGGHDPTLRHSYALQASYDNLSKKVGALGQYTYAPGSSSWSLVGGKVYEYILSGGFTRTVDLVQGTASFFLPGLSDDWRARLGVLRSEISYAATSLERAGPEVGLTYRNIQQGPDRITPISGGSANLSWAKYLSSWGNVAYDQWSFTGTAFQGLPGRTGLALTVRGQYAPDLTAALLGGTNLGGVYQFSLVSGSYLTRGYPTGTFIGRNIVNSSLEFRVPVSTPQKGWGILPVFLRRTHLNFFVDTIAVDGLGYNFESPAGAGFESITTQQFFTSAGVEYKWDMTLGYMAPAQVFVGAYYGLDQAFGGGFTPFLGLLF